MKAFSSLLFVLFLQLTYSQAEANNWYFGGNAGLNFNTNPPTVLNDGQLNTYEGCSSISNGSGQLLFYTDGSAVYNRLHQVMVNGTGLLGSYSSSQSSVVVPNPSNPNIYYIFTVTEANVATGICYSEVDLSLDGGLGAITATKNVVLISGEATEKLSAVQHANGVDYWVMCHDFGNANYHAYQVTAAGVTTTPVISTIGLPYNTLFSKLGCLKFSADGTKMADTHNFEPFYGIEVALFDFDSATGILSNYQSIPNPEYFTYGLEFSLSGDLLYVSATDNRNPNIIYHHIFQYNLNAPNIVASRQIIHSVSDSVLNFFIGTLQMAPDGKIYVSRYDSTYNRTYFISRIENPDVIGTSCNFVLNAINLYPGYCQLGLPQFIQSYFVAGIQAQNFCLGDSTLFSTDSNSPIVSINWDFGDGNTSTSLNPSHTYVSTGMYTVTATLTNATETITRTKDITISAVPTATQPNAILSCDTNNDGFYTFDLTQNTATILNGQLPSEFAVRYYAHTTDYANKIVINNPASYQNLVGYQSQTIVAEVYNLVNSNCNATTTFDIQVFETPTPATVVPAIRTCDDTSFGTNTDNRIVFDLTENETTILNGQSATDFTVTYYTDAGFTNMIVNPNNYVNGNATETIYVQVSTNLNTNCVGTTSFEIEVYANPTVNSPVTLQQCDDDNDGFSAFNLTEAENLIVTNTTGLTIAYFETWTDAQNNSNPITNITAYTNQTVSTAIVYVRITNANTCYSISELNLVVSTTLISNTIQETFTVCDDMASGSNTDGIATFDFSSANAQILAQYPTGQLLDITYYRNLPDALAEQNAIADITNYTNIGSPNSQDIYVRVDSRVNNDCLGLGHHITLNVESIPIVQPQNYTHCDDDHDGLYSFNTTTLENDLLNGLSNVMVTYFDALGNPINMTNPFITASQVLTVRVTNNTATACFYETTITFTVDDLPEAFVIPTNLTTVCDDEVNPSLQNGLYAFDTSSFQSTILGTQTGMQVNYYDENGNALTSPLPNPFVTGNQNILVEVINLANATCTATMTIPFLVNPIPEIDLQGDGLVCSDNTTFTLDINAGLLDPNTQNDYTYQWFFNGTLLPNETNYNLTVNTEGVYTVTVTNMSNCSRTRTITVTASDIATINDIQITDLSDSNSILILVSGEGDYEYSLDNSSYQSSNVFTNLEAGIYTVYVNDIYGCGIASKEISVLGIPKFFTPNGDGFNDTWNIQGVNEQLNANTIIYIFDRYGKLVKQISPLGTGWDGLFNGKPLPSSDYWYAIHLEDGRNIKGHFTLKR